MYCRESLLEQVSLPEAYGMKLGPDLGVSRDVVVTLIRAGSDLEGPLNLAAAHNRVEFLEMLLEFGADRNAIDATYGITPLQAAIYNGNPEAADILAREGIAPNALYVAAGAGRVDLLPQFVKRGKLAASAFKERPNLGDVGWPQRLPPSYDPDEVLGEAFTLAAYNGRVEAAQWLLDNGADVNARPYLKTTALHFAVLGGQQKMVDWLLDHNADPTLRDAQHDGTAASWARYSARTSETGPAILATLEKRTG